MDRNVVLRYAGALLLFSTLCAYADPSTSDLEKESKKLQILGNLLEIVLRAPTTSINLGGLAADQVKIFRPTGTGDTMLAKDMLDGLTKQTSTGGFISVFQTTPRPLDTLSPDSLVRILAVVSQAKAALPTATTPTPVVPEPLGMPKTEVHESVNPKDRPAPPRAVAVPKVVAPVEIAKLKEELAQNSGTPAWWAKAKSLVGQFKTKEDARKVLDGFPEGAPKRLLDAFIDARFNDDAIALRKQGMTGTDEKAQAAREEVKDRTADKDVQKFKAWFKVSPEQAMIDVATLKKGPPAEAGKFMAHMMSPLGEKLRQELIDKTGALLKEDAKEAKSQGLNETLVKWANQAGVIAQALWKDRDLKKLTLDTPFKESFAKEYAGNTMAWIETYHKALKGDATAKAQVDARGIDPESLNAYLATKLAEGEDGTAVEVVKKFGINENGHYYWGLAPNATNFGSDGSQLYYMGQTDGEIKAALVAANAGNADLHKAETHGLNDQRLLVTKFDPGAKGKNPQKFFAGPGGLTKTDTAGRPSGAVASSAITRPFNPPPPPPVPLAKTPGGTAGGVTDAEAMQILQKNCEGCHGNVTARRNFNINTPGAVNSRLNMIGARVGSGDMPQGTTMDAAERQKLLNWVAGKLGTAGPGGPGGPTGPT